MAYACSVVCLYTMSLTILLFQNIRIKAVFCTIDLGQWDFVVLIYINMNSLESIMFIIDFLVGMDRKIEKTNEKTKYFGLLGKIIMV